MDDTQRRILDNGLTAMGLSSRGREYDLLERYIDEIELWNPRYGLIAPGEDLIRRHILDSLSGLSSIRELNPSRMADIGSGAGFPGIPLAIWMPDTEVSLIERMGRRTGFLRNVAVGLGLTNVQILQKPVEEVSKEESGFDLVTFRAWSAIDGKVLDSIAAILEPDGVVAAFKGRRDVIDSELEKVADRISLQRITALRSPGSEGERHLVVFSLN